MNIWKRLVRLLWVCPFVLGSTLIIAPVQAQEDGDDDEAVEEIVVTGSKLRRDAFTSISPVQVLGGQDAIRIGIADTTQMIAESPVVFGTQLDGSDARLHPRLRGGGPRASRFEAKPRIRIAPYTF